MNIHFSENSPARTGKYVLRNLRRGVTEKLKDQNIAALLKIDYRLASFPEKQYVCITKNRISWQLLILLNMSSKRV